MATRSSDSGSRADGAGAAAEPRYSLRAVVRMTGLTEHTIRAWERRYAAVEPARTPGGTRRYSAADVARLRLLRECTEAGHRISELAPLPDDALEALLGDAPRAAREPVGDAPLRRIREAVERLDLRDAENLLSMQFAALGPMLFARELAAPLLREIGDRWERGDASVAAEHMLSSLTRGILGAALRASGAQRGGPRVVFATPTGEQHEFGALIAAITAMGAGADVTYLGADLPADELARAAERVGARAVALGIVGLDPSASRAFLEDLARRLPRGVEVWCGGSGAVDAPGCEVLELEALERRIQRLARTPGGDGANAE